MTHYCKPVAAGTSQLNIGTFADDNGTLITAFARCVTTERVHKYDTTVEDGVVQYDTTRPEKNFFHEGSSYEFWVTNRGADVSLSDRKTITMGGTAATSISISFQIVRDDSGAVVAYDSQNAQL